MLGNTAVSSVNAAGSFVIYSDGRYKENLQEDVPGLDFMKQLRPVTYHYDIPGMNDKIGITAQQSKITKAGNAGNVAIFHFIAILKTASW
jgi:trimeric autotransporter adhesin